MEIRLRKIQFLFEGNMPDLLPYNNLFFLLMSHAHSSFYINKKSIEFPITSLCMKTVKQ